MATIKRAVLVSVLGFLVLAGVSIAALAKQNKPGPLRIGYFHGGRTVLMLRAYENLEFEKAGIEVDFYSKELYGDDYALVPRSIKEFNLDGGSMGAGKVKGTELIDGMLEGKFDLAMVGESSFIYAVYAGVPIVAIAELGHDVKGHAGHVFLMRKGLKADKPEDYFGKLFISRRAGPGDAIFLKEYFKHAGVNVDKDIIQLEAIPSNLKEKGRLPRDKIIVVDSVYEDKIKQGIKNGVVDGGYFHLMGVPKLLDSFYITHSLDDWANPELSHALLVCTKGFLKNNRARLITLLQAYIKRIKYEHGLSYAERTKPQEKGLQMATNLSGLNYPQYDIIPTVSVDLLSGVTALLREYHFIGNKNLEIKDYVDNGLVLEALNNLGITEKDDYWQSEY